MVFGLFSRNLKPRSESPAPVPPPSPSITPPPIPDPSHLQALILSVPPKTLQSYTLAHLGAPPDPATLSALTTFFAALTPPPRLHCLRCHKDYYDVENTDRSCHVPHDDDSAEVERVGRSAGATKGKAGSMMTEYETLWGCCGQSVEGDGDMGPPDGWCYEGKHTTDVKRARFRADSTLHDEKLVSCDRLNCHGTRPDTASPRSSRKRARLSFAEDSDNGSVSGSDIDGSSKTKPTPKPVKPPASTKGKGKASTPTTTSATIADAEGDVGMDTENSHSNPIPAKPHSVKSKPTSRAPAQPSPLASKSKSLESSAPGSTSPKLRPRPNPDPKPRSRSRARSTARGGRSRPIAKLSSASGEERDSDVNEAGEGDERKGRKVNKKRKL